MMPSIPMKVRTVRFYAFSPEDRAAAEKLKRLAWAAWLLWTWVFMAVVDLLHARYGWSQWLALPLVMMTTIGFNVYAHRKTSRVLESWRDVACDMDVPPFEERLVFMVTHGRRQESAKVSQLVN